MNSKLVLVFKVSRVMFVQQKDIEIFPFFQLDMGSGIVCYLPLRWKCLSCNPVLFFFEDIFLVRPIDLGLCKRS